MFNYLSGVGVELRTEMVQLYWILLLPMVILLFALEVLRDENPNLRDLFRRIIISILLLYSFDWMINSIAIIGDAVTDKIQGLEKLSDVLANLGPNYSGKDSWFSLRESVIYIFSLTAYIVAYLGFFVATALTHFVWTTLYVASPLMILMYVSRATAHVTASLYKGLIQVVVWKVLWSILGVLLLKLAMQPEVTGLENYLMSIVLNLCIGFSMLFIPLVTRSLISDGMSSVASSLAAVPAIAAGGAIKMAATKFASKFAGATAGTAMFGVKPLTNPVTGRAAILKDKLKPRFEQFKKNYSSIGLPKKPTQPKEEN